jgi:hypothetical protein
VNLTFRGINYATKGKLDAFTQLHIARKLGPTLPIVEGLVKPENDKKGKDLITVLMLSHISDEDTEYVIRKCLSVIVRQPETEGPFAPIQNTQGGLMFDNITMSDMLGLTIGVIEENLGDFFRTSLADLKAEEKKLPA